VNVGTSRILQHGQFAKRSAQGQRTFARFNENQPRGKDGRWIATGDVAAAAGSVGDAAQLFGRIKEGDTEQAEKLVAFLQENGMSATDAKEAMKQGTGRESTGKYTPNAAKVQENAGGAKTPAASNPASKASAELAQGIQSDLMTVAEISDAYGSTKDAAEAIASFRAEEYLKENLDKFGENDEPLDPKSDRFQELQAQIAERTIAQIDMDKLDADVSKMFEDATAQRGGQQVLQAGEELGQGIQSDLITVGEIADAYGSTKDAAEAIANFRAEEYLKENLDKFGENDEPLDPESDRFKDLQAKLARETLNNVDMDKLDADVSKMFEDATAQLGGKQVLQAGEELGQGIQSDLITVGEIADAYGSTKDAAEAIANFRAEWHLKENLDKFGENGKPLDPESDRFKDLQAKLARETLNNVDMDKLDADVSRMFADLAAQRGNSR
jgi:hypothetical protein